MMVKPEWNPIVIVVIMYTIGLIALGYACLISYPWILYTSEPILISAILFVIGYLMYGGYLIAVIRKSKTKNG